MGFGQYSPDGLGGRNRPPLPRSTKTKRVKTVFGSHSNTAHVWAQQTFEYGKSSDGRLYFNGPAIFSYGSHFKIAEFTKKKTKDGKRVVLFTNAKYSSSTGGHKSDAWGALNGLTDVQIVNVPDLSKWTGSKKQVREARDNALIAIAQSMRISARAKASDTPDTWRIGYRRDQAKSQRAALATFLLAFNSKLTIPKDVVAWDDARVSTAKYRAKQDAIKLAKADIAKANRMLPEFKTLYGAVADDIEAHRVESIAREIDNAVTKLKAHDRTLRLAKAFPTYRTKAQAAIAALEPVNAIWQAAVEPARANAALRSRHANLREYIDGEMRYKDSERLGALWADAIAFGKPVELIERLATETHKHAHEESLPRVRQQQVPMISADEWLSGKGTANAPFPGESRLGTLVRRKAGRLETSRGAEVPWKHAVIAFHKAQDCRAKRKTWETNGDKLPVGHFHVDRIDAEGNLRAGCHTIAYAEMLRLAVKEIPELVRPTYPLPVPVAA